MGKSSGSTSIFKVIGFLIVIFLIFVIIRGGILEQKHQKGKRDKLITFYEQFDHYFKGVVVKIKRRPPMNESGKRIVCYRIQLIESTTPYLARKKGSDYFCIIDFPFAEVMSTDYGNSGIGDTCFYNGTSDCISIKTKYIQWHSEPLDGFKNRWFSIYALIPTIHSKWHSSRPEIFEHNLLSPPYSLIPYYDSLQFEARKRTYPEPRNASVEQVNYYWDYGYSNRLVNSADIKYNLEFYNQKNWLNEREYKELVKKKQVQSDFYMLQVDEYKEPLDLKALKEKYEGEPILWVEHNGTHKYYINKRFDTPDKAETYLDKVIENYPNLTEKEYPEIKKLQRKKEDVEKDLKELLPPAMLDDTRPDIETIPYPRSLLKHAWWVFMIFTFINVLMVRGDARERIKYDKALAKGFRTYAFGLLVLLNIWLISMGIGIETGMVDNIYEFMLNKGNAIVIISNIYLLIFLFFASRWMYLKNGAEILARLRSDPSVVFSPKHTPDGIKLVWSILVALGLVYIFARLFI